VTTDFGAESAEGTPGALEPKPGRSPSSSVCEPYPGEEAKVDYGAGPMVRDPQTGKYRRTRLFHKDCRTINGTRMFAKRSAQSLSRMHILVSDVSAIPLPERGIAVAAGPNF
jgi:hypothetical protein